MAYGNNNGKWGKYSGIVAGLPWDVQAKVVGHLIQANVNPSALYRLPLLFSTDRLSITAGGSVTGSWRYETLSCVYGISASFSNETNTNAAVTAGMSGLSLVWPDEVDMQVTFNQGQTYWVGGSSNKCSLAAIGSADHVSRLDPIMALKQDVWECQLDGQAGMANTVYSRVTLHGVKFYGATGGI